MKNWWDMPKHLGRKVDVTKRTRLTAGLFRETCLSTSGSRLALAILLAVGVLSVALPASAEDWIVQDEGDLTSAIAHAHKGDSITFTTDITLSANLPVVRRDVTINGGNHTLSGGNNQYRGLFVKSGIIAINDLTITNAKAQGGRGGDARHYLGTYWAGRGAGGDGHVGNGSPGGVGGGGGGAEGKGGPGGFGGGDAVDDDLHGGGGGGAGLGGAIFVQQGGNPTLVGSLNISGNIVAGGNGGGYAKPGQGIVIVHDDAVVFLNQAMRWPRRCI